MEIREAILNDPTPSQPWNVAIQNSGKENHFLLILAPIFEDIFCELNNTITLKYPHLNHWVSESLLFNFILNSFALDAKEMMIRSCVLQLYIASKNHMLTGDTASQRFDYFIELLCQRENTLDLFDSFPLLEQQLNISIQQYLSTTQELFSRLNQDYQELLIQFFGSDPNYELTAINATGDTHEQGRKVMTLEFSNSKSTIKIVYKPRSLAIDVAFQNFITWFNAHTPHLKLNTINIINKENYGWCEFIAYQPCNSSAEVSQFYYRCGIWLMLMVLFRGSDIHAENIIAHGSYPTIVDFECLINPWYTLIETKDPNISRFFVNETALLPGKAMVSPEYKGFDISAMGAEGGEEAFYTTITWIDSGKDTMHAERIREVIPPFLNKPMLQQSSVNALDYEEYFMQGFEDSYHFILNNLPALLRESSPLHQFEAVKIRVLMRNTHEYANLLLESWHPKFLVDPKTRADHFSRLKAIVASVPLYEDVVTAELHDLEQKNIPLFTSESNGETIHDSTGKALKIKILKSGYETLWYHVQHYLNEEDLEIQKNIIANHFEASRLNTPTPSSPLKNQVPGLSLQVAATDSLDALRKTALEIAKRELDYLAKHHIHNRERIFWPTVIALHPEVWQASYSDINLFDGVAGIALAFAYGGKVLENAHYQDFARRCFNSIRLTLVENGVEFVNKVGGYNGLGGLIYALSSFYRLWQDDRIKNDIQNLLAGLSKLLNEDKTYNIIDGAAGCLAALLSLRDIFPHTQILPYATACANHILQQPHNSLPLSFGYGISGVIWALQKFQNFAEEVTLQNFRSEATQQSFTPKAEQQNFPSEATQQWLTSALAEEQKKLDNAEITADLSWHQGAVGIALAKIDLETSLQNSTINRIFQAIYTQGHGRYQCLQYGNLAKLEFLLTATQHNSTPEAAQHYHHFLAETLKSLSQNTFHCSPPKNFATPGLMTGRAGIAYQMLRIADSTRVPCVLLLKSGN